MLKIRVYSKRVRQCLLRCGAISLMAVSMWLAITGCSNHNKGSDSHLYDASSSLVYYSDYFSFIGEDAQGRVAFALDNNRGRDGDTWQAEHFLVMHDEHRGWINVAGNGAYNNEKHILASIPDSSFFHFKGSPENGLTISSPDNKLTLELAPIPKRFTRTHKDAVYWMGSTAATLHWEDRKLKGRVIYEYLHIPGFNRLTRTYLRLWRDFHGIYAQMGSTGDFYWHTQHSPVLEILTGRSEGFLFHNGNTAKLGDLEVNVMKRVQAKGLYRWPIHWTGQWEGGRGSFTITLSELKVISNWVVGGFSMGIIKGEVRYGNSTLTLYGLGELIM